jgi:PEP-CTERM motif
MSKRILTVFVAVLGVGITLLAVPTFADSVQFDVTQVSGNVWQYQYFVSGRTFAANQAFTIFFDPTLYTSLQSPPPSATDWHTFVLQPDLNLNSSGNYTSEALVDNASLSSSFSLTFMFIGLGTPSSQLFEVDQFDASGKLTSVLSTGVTSPVTSRVSEPSSIVLMGIGVIGLVVLVILRR